MKTQESWTFQEQMVESWHRVAEAQTSLVCPCQYPARRSGQQGFLLVPLRCQDAGCSRVHCWNQEELSMWLQRRNPVLRVRDTARSVSGLPGVYRASTSGLRE